MTVIEGSAESGSVKKVKNNMRKDGQSPKDELKKKHWNLVTKLGQPNFKVSTGWLHDWK